MSEIGSKFSTRGVHPAAMIQALEAEFARAMEAAFGLAEDVCDPSVFLRSPWRTFVAWAKAEP